MAHFFFFFFYSFAEKYSIVWMGHVLSIYLEGYLGGFQVLAIRNTVAVNILIQSSMWTCL